MRRKHCGFIGILFSLAVLLSASEVRAAEFSAQVGTQFQGKESLGKVYVKGKRLRQEMPSESGAMVVIYNADTQVAWMLMPDKKMYLEMPITDDMIRGLMQVSKDQAGMKLLGTEKVNGYNCDKYETAFRINGPMPRFTVLETSALFSNRMKYGYLFEREMWLKGMERFFSLDHLPLSPFERAHASLKNYVEEVGVIRAGAVHMATLTTHLVFSKWLNCQFPHGLFGF